MQLCDDCGINPATMHLTQIKNEATTVSHLCDECAKKHGISISLEQSNEPVQNKKPEVPDTLCLQCGFALSEFKATGRLGCARAGLQTKRQFALGASLAGLGQPATERHTQRSFQ